MAYLFYNFILALLLLLSTPYLFVRSLFNRSFRNSLRRRLSDPPEFPGRGTLWVHAASVGEVLCSIPLVKRMKEEYPKRSIVLTTMTVTGKETAETKVPEAEGVLLFPIDQPILLRRIIRKIRPGLLLIAETELWPNLLRVCGKRNIPILLFNGRISDRSFRRYRFLRFFFRTCLKYVSIFLMQSEKDRERIIDIGGPRGRTRVTGNIKFDQEPPAIPEAEKTALIRSLRLKGGEKVLIGGSTHPGEEEILCSLFKSLKKTHPDLFLILAPRHLNRLEEVGKILDQESLSWVKRTSLLPGRNPPSGQEERPGVLLLDTMGELVIFYSLGTVVFIGGSLVPVGGHNPIEPLFYRKCVVFGPHMFNFTEITSRLVGAGGALQVKGAEEFASRCKDLLSDERRCNEIGEKGYRFLLEHRGATERSMKEIRPFLKPISDCRFKISD
jgi:3-deoxy-D-manno-octulosonic-acid transferase